MAQQTISITVSDSVGATATQTVAVIQDLITITSMTVVPQTAPAGTGRTLTVIATSSAGSPLTFGTPVSAGITFTAVGGQPAGQMQWTFVY